MSANDEKARILIVDDEPPIREILRTLLHESYECVEAYSAEEALTLLQAEDFDLVLSDIKMSGIGGLEMVPQVLLLAPDTVVIMISGEQAIENAIAALQVGAFDYITKPFDLQRVETAVRRGIEHHALLVCKRDYENHLRLLNSVTVNANDAIVITEAEPFDEPGPRIVFVNEAFTRMTGYSAEEVIGKTPRILGGIKTERAELDKIRAALEKWQPVRVELINYCKDGSEFWVDINIVPVADENGRFTHWVSIQREMTERKKAEEALRKAHDSLERRVEERTVELVQTNASLREQIIERERAEEQISYLAYHDSLTGLPNRALFKDRLAQSLIFTSRNEKKMAIMLLSLDRFKKFTDTLGHVMADRLLCIIAERLTSAVRQGDTVARFEGDEFSLLLTQINCTTEVAEIARTIQETLKMPFTLDDHELYVTASIGIGLYPDDGQEPEMLLKNAGAALYRAKQRGASNYQFYTSDMNARAIKRFSLENSLRRALERDEFVVHYQPQVNSDTRQIVGVEALVRWQHPELGLVSPAEFIPLAEDTGLIIPIGEWVLHTACVQAKLWQEAGFASLRVAVNLSPRQFQQTDLVGMIDGVLKETGLHPDHLELELTESAVMENAERAIATLDELRGYGIKISIDDFGSGYSSLSYLKHLPVDVLKIDQTFIRDMTLDPNTAAIVMAIITLAHSLKLKVVAEGVETEEQLRFLRLLRCDEIQGYLFSRPLAVEALERLLLAERNLSELKTLSLSHI